MPTRTAVRIHTRCRIDRIFFNHYWRRRYDDRRANHDRRRHFDVHVRAFFWLVVFAVVLVVGFYLMVVSSVAVVDWINSFSVRNLLIAIVVLLLLILFRLRR
jgi:uncharacterized BrkB/YihY/UPF0761 family membrane protein